MGNKIIGDFLHKWFLFRAISDRNKYLVLYYKRFPIFYPFNYWKVISRMIDYVINRIEFDND